jgi:hypothetical protein
MFQLWTSSRLGRLDYTLRRAITFFAPLTDSLDFMGVEPAGFSRGFASAAIWRDGLSHAIPANVPRFQYYQGGPLGLYLVSGESLFFSSMNGLDNANTLMWFEDNVAKCTPTNTNPFASSGFWVGNLDVHIKHLAKANTTLAFSDIQKIQQALIEPPIIVTTPTPPTPPPSTTGVFVQEVPAGTRNGSNVTFTLSHDPNPASMVLNCFGIVLELVSSNPGQMQFTLSGTGNRTITLGMGPTTNYPFQAIYVTA